jgi:hypothetical protein
MNCVTCGDTLREGYCDGRNPDPIKPVDSGQCYHWCDEHLIQPARRRGICLKDGRPVRSVAEKLPPPTHLNNPFKEQEHRRAAEREQQRSKRN